MTGPAARAKRPRPAPRHETRVLLLALLAGAPAVAATFLLMSVARLDTLTQVSVGIVVTGVWLAAAAAARERVGRSLQTVSNMLAAIREGDFSVRGRGTDPRSPLGLAMLELNALTDSIERERLGAREATALLAHVMDTIDVAVFAFDAGPRLRLVNRDGERLLGMPAERALGQDAAALGLADCLAGDTPRLVRLALPGGGGRWELRRGAYRHAGRPHDLVVLSDLTRSLREEEREAWWRLIRVLSHEINNSLAPIQSIAGSLRSRLGATDSGGANAGDDIREGLVVIETRAQSLGRFLRGYAELARLPKPAMRRVDVGDWVRRVAGLETRLAVRVAPGLPVTIDADGDQLEQLLINLVRNAADAAIETGGGVTVGWTLDGPAIRVEVVDEGAGIATTENLFVPFFTTKPEGTGVGLALGRQIAEAHGGTLTLENRRGARGAVATLRLPVRAIG